MKKNSDIIREKAASITEDAQDLLDATSDVAEQKVVEARKRLSDALDRGKEMWGQAQDYAVEKARAADEVIRDYPYQSIAIAFGVGTLVGLLLMRRRSA